MNTVYDGNHFLEDDLGEVFPNRFTFIQIATCARKNGTMQQKAEHEQRRCGVSGCVRVGKFPN